MPFTLDTWRAQFKSGLASWKQRVLERKADSLYGALAATALWPVIAAFQHGDVMALMAVGQLLSNVATNFLATGIQKWRDEAEAASALNAQLATDAASREQVDALLTKLEAIKLAHEELPEAQRQWFVDTLRSELQALGNAQKYEATLRSVIVGGDMIGSTIMTGDNSIGTVQGNVYYGPTPQDTETALKIYCRVLLASCRHLPLRGIDVGASDPTSDQQRLELAQVYVNLDTTLFLVSLVKDVESLKNKEQEARNKERNPRSNDIARQQSILSATINKNRLVVLGDPGSGKSTFINFLALCLAAHRCEPKGRWLDRLEKWPERDSDLVPIIIVLRDFAKWLPNNVKVKPRLLWDFICERIADQNLDFVREALHKKLEAGQALVLLDGLDEIPNASRRILVREAIVKFSRRYYHSRMLASCRTLSYQNTDWQIPDWPAYKLLPFDDQKITSFIQAWYAELHRIGLIKTREAASLSQRLQEALQRPELKRLSPNPLLLTVMALVHTHRGSLPDARVLLYEETVDMLLWHWEQIKNESESQTSRLRQLLRDAGRSEVDLKRTLWRLAFDAHKEGGLNDGETLAGIGELRLEKILAELHPQNSRDWAQNMVEALKLRAGLLLEREREVFTFPHRTFQEYLAGAQLSTQADFATVAAKLYLDKPYWREAILLAVGRLVNVVGETDKSLALASELYPRGPFVDETSWRKFRFASDILVEMGLHRVNDSNWGRRLLSDARQSLMISLRRNDIPPIDRTGAGDVLGQLGDTRFRSETWYLPDQPLLGFIEIPGGNFIMGSNKKRDQEAFEYEQPQHQLFLSTFYMGCFPVTVAQFRSFVEASGRQPDYDMSLVGLANYPVVNVSWYDTIAYCEWLTANIREWSQLPEELAILIKQDGWRIALPSEAEWEKAARGQDARIYPWGNEFNSGFLNYKGVETGRRSAPGCFPFGTSPYGCEDMSGNVWEWTRSLWGEHWSGPDFHYPYHPGPTREALNAPREIRRVWRGGAFNLSARNVRCASRNSGLPFDTYSYVGFRIALVPPQNLESLVQ